MDSQDMQDKTCRSYSLVLFVLSIHVDKFQPRGHGVYASSILRTALSISARGTVTWVWRPALR
jgi:hypothetical protein